MTLQVCGRNPWPKIKRDYRSHKVTLKARFPQASERELDAFCEELAMKAGMTEVNLVGKLVIAITDICSKTNDPKGRDKRVTELRTRMMQTIHVVDNRYTPYVASVASEPADTHSVTFPIALPA